MVILFSWPYYHKSNRIGILVSTVAASHPTLYSQGMDLLLDVNRHRGHGQVLRVLLVFPLPRQLRVQRWIAGIENRIRLILFYKSPQLFGRYVHPLVSVFNVIDGGGGIRFLFRRHYLWASPHRYGIFGR